jgi:hypothetical protein
MATDSFLNSFKLGPVSLKVRHAGLIDESIFDGVFCRIGIRGGPSITIHRRSFFNNSNWELMDNRTIFGQTSEVLLINCQICIVWMMGDEITQPFLNVATSDTVLLAKSSSDRRIIG